MREAKRIIRALGEVDEKYIEEAMPGKKNRGHLSWKKLACVVACLILLLSLSLATYAANWFGVRDLLLPFINQSEQPPSIEEVTEKETKEEIKEEDNIIGLSGYRGSAEWQALAEWNSFLAGYDSNHAILDKIGNEAIEGSREDWAFYGVYTKEMEGKLDEIAEKYGLKLHTECNVISQDELMERVGGCFMDKDDLTWAYMYEDGYFHVEGDVKLSEAGNVDFQLIRSVKGTINDVMLRIDEIEKYTEWQYITSGGETVLLAAAPLNDLIFADFKDCFIAVNVLYKSESGMTKESLQELADRIDFGILKEVQVPVMRGDSVVEPTEEPLFSELTRGKIGKLGTGVLAYTVPYDDTQDYRLCFFTDENEKAWKIENAAYVFPDAREGNIPIGTFQTFAVFQTGGTGEIGDEDILLVGYYGVGEELLCDARVYRASGDGYLLDAALTQEWNEKYGAVTEENENDRTEGTEAEVFFVEPARLEDEKMAYEDLWTDNRAGMEVYEQDFDNDGMVETAFCFPGVTGTGVEKYRLVLFDDVDGTGTPEAYEFVPELQLQSKLKFDVDTEAKRLYISKNGAIKRTIDWKRYADAWDGDCFGIDCFNQITFVVDGDKIKMRAGIGITLNQGGPTIFFEAKEGGVIDFDIIYSDGVYEME